MDKHITLSYPIEVYEMMMAVAPGELYTPLERMFLPFQSEVWVAIALTLFFWLVSIQIINFFPLKVRNFVYGRGINTPSINLAENFSQWWAVQSSGAKLREIPTHAVGHLVLDRQDLLSVATVPISSGWQKKARTQIIRWADWKGFHILLRWFIECLLWVGGWRTRLAIVRTMIDLVNWIIFLFYFCSPNCLYFYEKEDRYQRFEKAAETANKLVIPVTASDLASINNDFRFGRSSLIPIKENIKTFHDHLTYKAKSPFKEIFDHKLIQFHEVGFLARFSTKRNSLKNPEIEIGPEVLTMDHLEIGFLACLVPLLLSAACFAVEIGRKRRASKKVLSKQQKTSRWRFWITLEILP